MAINNINHYLIEIKKKLSSRSPAYSKSPDDLKNYPLSVGQCLYIIDYQRNKITFQKGVKELLGFNEDEFTVETASSLFHPDDLDLLSRVFKATMLYATENNVASDVAFYGSYRIRHKNGNYFKVLSQSNTHEHDEHGRIISNICMLSDISFMDHSNRVEWKFDAPGINADKFRDYILKEYKAFFTPREQELIKLLKAGLKSVEIAGKLGISRHTVDTHRRKILQKSNCENTIELIDFCKQIGVL